MKKLLGVILASLLAIGFCCGCGGKDPSAGEYADRPIKFEFSYYAGGFGKEWLEAVTKDYMDNVDKDVYIKLRSSSSNPTAQGNISAGVGASDLHQIEIGMFNMASSLEDISDVYDMTVYGENVKVRDKINPEMIDFYNEKGKFYQLSLNRRTGWNWVYNSSVLDATLGKGNYTLPRTTDEFFALGEELYNKGVYLTAGALNDKQGGEYLVYAFHGWFAQMLGYETNQRYFDGYALNDAGEWEFCRTSPKMVKDNEAAIEAVYALAEKLCKRGVDMQYLHKESGSMGYKDLDQVFYGGKFKKNETQRFAFAYIGEWLEREVSVFFEQGVLKDRDQGILAMKMPVISAITSRTESINDDVTLAKVVDYVDGKGELPAGVTEKDVAIVREARNVVVENQCNQLVIPKSAKNKDAIKKFITYLCSDRAQKIAAQAASGSSVLPFGYIPTDEDMGFTISDLIKSFRKVADKESVVVVDTSHLNDPLVQVSGFNWYYDSKNPNKEIAKDIFGGSYTAVSDIAKATYDYYSRGWESYIKSYDAYVAK